jgi:PAS domain S-box-containing protein
MATGSGGGKDASTRPRGRPDAAHGAKDPHPEDDAAASDRPGQSGAPDGQRDAASAEAGPKEGAGDLLGRIRLASDGSIASVDRRAESFTGWTTAEVAGKPVGWLLVAEGDSSDDPPPAGTPLRLDAALLRDRAGKKTPVMLQMERTGRGIEFVLRDATAERANVAAIRRINDQLMEAQEVAGIGSWHWDIKGDQITWSDELYRIYGLQPQSFEATYDAFLERIEESDRERVNNVVQAAYRDHEPFSFDHRIVRPDGEVRILHGQGAVAVAPDGSPLRMYGVAQDITSLRQADQARARLASIVQASHDAILSVDLKGNIESWNEAAQRMYGVAAEEAIDRNVVFLSPPGHADVLPKRLKIIAAGGEVEPFESPRRSKDGSILTVATSLSPLTDAAGRVVGAAIIDRDVTERRRGELADRVAFERLMQIRQLEEMARQRSELLSTLAHELNTPLTPLQIQIGLLAAGKRGAVTDEQRKSLDVLQRNVDRLAHLVADVLESARLDSGRLATRPVQVDAARIIRQVCEDHGAVAQQASLRLELEAPATLQARLDPDRLEQVLQNLLSNAFKYTPVGGFVRVALEQADDRLRLTVTDSGVGMTQEQTEQLFRPFSQVQAAPVQREGTGLGLFIARGIVRRHGGELRVHSDGPGQGSTFTLDLPLDGPPGDPATMSA